MSCVELRHRPTHVCDEEWGRRNLIFDAQIRLLSVCASNHVTETSELWLNS